MTAATYQGRPCKRGHPGIRYTGNHTCIECHKVYRARWYINAVSGINSERVKSYAVITDGLVSALKTLRQPTTRQELADTLGKSDKSADRVLDVLLQHGMVERIKSGGSRVNTHGPAPDTFILSAAWGGPGGAYVAALQRVSQLEEAA